MNLEICAHVFNLMRIRICSEICQCSFTLISIYELYFVAIIKLIHVQGIPGCFKRSVIKDCCLVCILKHDYCILEEIFDGVASRILTKVAIIICCRFVGFETIRKAETAIQKFDGFDLGQGVRLKVALAQTRKKPTLADPDELEPKVNGATCNGVQDSDDKGPSERYAVSQI